MGYLYAQGSGVERDEIEALRWYMQAANQGDPAAQYEVGCAYEKGDLGVPRMEEEAQRWYQLAAEQGHEEAKTSLERMSEPQISKSWWEKLFP